MPIGHTKAPLICGAKDIGHSLSAAHLVIAGTQAFHSGTLPCRIPVVHLECNIARALSMCSAKINPSMHKHYLPPMRPFSLPF